MVTPPLEAAPPETDAAEMDNTPLDASGQPMSKKALKKLQEKQEKEAKKREKAEALKRELEEKAAKEMANDFSKDRYGLLPINQSQQRTNVKRYKISEFKTLSSDSHVSIRARIHAIRPKSSKMCFIVLRQESTTVQAVCIENGQTISKSMVKYVANLPIETIVIIEGKVKEAQIESCDVHNAEIHIEKVYAQSQPKELLPFDIEAATVPLDTKPSDNAAFTNPPHLDNRLNNRIIDLRTITNRSIYTLKDAICSSFRNFLHSKDFLEIQTPKLINAASEGGANVFKVTYFNRDGFLAQSPQLYKQMMITADFEKVFEIGPEFTGVDMEMAFEEHYHEVMELIGEMFIHIFKTLKENYQKHIDIVAKQYPSEPFLYKEPTLVLKYSEGIELLRENGVELADDDDLSTENERKLGALVREKFKTDFYALDKFPLKIRPFYTMPNADNPALSNSYDFFMRGEEILSGAQRIHDPQMLVEAAKKHEIDIKSIQGYLDAFKYAVAPHAGGGIGLERVLMLYCNLENIRRASLFPRDPKRLEP